MLIINSSREFLASSRCISLLLPTSSTSPSTSSFRYQLEDARPEGWSYLTLQLESHFMMLNPNYTPTSNAHSLKSQGNLLGEIDALNNESSANESSANIISILLDLNLIDLRILLAVSKFAGINAKVLGQKVNMSRKHSSNSC